MFTKGGTLLVSGTTANDGIYQINPFIDPTSDTIQVLETFTTEPAGSMFLYNRLDLPTFQASLKQYCTHFRLISE